MKRKYRLLFTHINRRKRGPKGPSPELISTIVEMKYRYPRFGYQRIADQICLQFDVDLEKDVVVAFSLSTIERSLAPTGPPGSSFQVIQTTAYGVWILFDANR